MDQLISGKVLLDLNLIDEGVGSLLHYAVILSTTTTTTPLLEKSPDSPPTSLKIVANLIDLDKCEINIVNRMGQTPLHMCKNLQIARLLLDKGASMSIRECTGKQPLFTCLCSAQYDMCVEMLKRGCALENVDRLGNSLLYALLNSSNAPFKLISLLLEAGISLDKQDWLQKRQYPNKR